MPGRPRRFVVCSVCGNKRCPKATDHRNECTGSNRAEPGSAYKLPAAQMTDIGLRRAWTRLQREADDGRRVLGRLAEIEREMRVRGLGWAITK